ncbi:tyrosinase family oxidase copper chaperone [Streptomyces sp. ISL-66]|uniref:tyrosinase family oxidase copper chaperone n=1 Tax=Streptomyces sp. ISL-66 TaxID=2819186 RepID=UPI0027E5262C|nr:tyrosinase family oxidase copper chaperone [Streptomyces sp. ISL-66]
MKRRDMVKLAAGTAVAAAVPAALVAVTANTPDGSGSAARAAGNGADELVETYKGRTIRIGAATGEHQAVYIDDRPLHVMKLGENAYMSSMCHYGLEASPLVAARRAVDELRGAQLLAAKETGSAGGHGHSA